MNAVGSKVFLLHEELGFKNIKLPTIPLLESDYSHTKKEDLKTITPHSNIAS
jgi:hypothetical protein